VLGRSHAYARWLQDEAVVGADTVRPVDPQAAHEIIGAAIEAPHGPTIGLDLATTRRLLGTYGLVMAEAVEATPDTAIAAAERIGFPVAVKAVRRRPGRSARAGVALDLTNSDDIEEAIGIMHESLGDDAEDLVVQAMTSPGVDVRIRCEHDDRLGAIVTVGLGGAQADAIDDRSNRLAPVSPASAASMVRETRLAAALDAAGLDSWQLVDAIVLAAQLASDHPQIAELDLNPVIVSDDGAIVTDATIRLEAHADEDGPIRRLD
jgi:acyl-CoA synthetase (NDP forming)